LYHLSGSELALGALQMVLLLSSTLLETVIKQTAIKRKKTSSAVTEKPTEAAFYILQGVPKNWHHFCTP